MSTNGLRMEKFLAVISYISYLSISVGQGQERRCIFLFEFMNTAFNYEMVGDGKHIRRRRALAGGGWMGVAPTTSG